MPSLLERLCGEGKADAGVVIPSVSVLSLQPDDILVLSVQARLNDRQREALRAAVGQAVPGHRVLVLEDGMELEVLRLGAEDGAFVTSDQECTGGVGQNYGPRGP